MVYSVHPGICVFSCCSLLNFLEHTSHSTSWALSLCKVWASVFLPIPRLHMALHPSRDPIASVYHLLSFIPLCLMSFHPNHIPPSFPCPTARVWLGQPAKQSGFGYSVVRHACKVAKPLQPFPLGLLSSSRCITPRSPHFSHSDMFSPLLTVEDSQYVLIHL